MHYACLIVELAADPAQQLQSDLPAYDIKAHTVTSCEAALALMEQWGFDAIVLDTEIPGPRCIAVLQRLRRKSPAPLVVLARTRDELCQVAALESGASDVVVLPASSRLIAAKLRRLIETGAATEPQDIEVHVGSLLMNARHRTAIVGDQTLALTVQQFDLLFLLASQAGQFVHRETITRVLQSRAACAGRCVDAHVYRIRKALRAAGVAGVRLGTVHGRGYCLAVDAASTADPVAVRPAFGGSNAYRPVPERVAVGQAIFSRQS